MIKALKKREAKLCRLSNSLELLSEFDCPSMIRPILESVNRDPDEAYEDEQGEKLSLYEKCLKRQHKIPTVFGLHLYEGLHLMPVPPWPRYAYMPPLHPHRDALLSKEDKKKVREREEKDRKYMMPPPKGWKISLKSKL